MAFSRSGVLFCLPGYLPGVATPGRDVESQSDEAMRLCGTNP